MAAGATQACPAAPAAERRLVSVLFADLVGFTAASEGRDAEDTRELLSRYFEAARTIVERYGGTVEKFIGDAVMAVWGTPVAQEDDAERAVRAALDLVAGVPELDAALTARAGISTGEAAVTLGAEGQGMVAGDLVNTASRIQSTAPPGSVLVGRSTRRASESAIAYEDVGRHELKGKTEPEQLWRAIRVVAARGGEGRAAGLEAPFVGRDSELRLVKELFHATADEKRARLVSVIGVAGVGKSRLAWEFFKYMDGLSEEVWWHRGRCLAYGDGVAYWALAEMVRGRIGALEDDPPDATATKLHDTVAQHFPEPVERAWVEERLLPLVGLGEHTTAEQEDLFPAWRRFFERLAEQGPLVLLFEDLHWADAGLIAFVEHLLDWSRNHPILVVTLARPEIVERHPGFPGATRSATTLPLDPLSDTAMTELLRGLVPGLPDDILGRIRERADGIPLYAVETVRMLLDRGVVEPAGNEYRLTGPVAALEVPETLHALIASRLDGLPDEERGLVQDAAVLGQTFTLRGLAALSGMSEDEIAPILASLQRKEVVYVETDPRSPERGQYGFLQALVQRVAYETLARRERRARHLAAAKFLAEESGIETSEIAEVIAAHYLDAFETDSAAADGADVKASARSWFVRAAERALTLAAAAEAQRAFERAAALADDGAERARLLFRAGETALMAGDREAAERHLTEVIPAFGEAGLTYEQAQASSKLGFVFVSSGRIAEAVERMEESLAVFDERGDEAAAATVAAQLGRFHFLEGHRDLALEYVERSLEVGERLRLPEAVSQALQTKALLLEHRPYESIALMRGAVEVAREHDVSEALSRGYINLSYLLWVTGGSNAVTEPVIRDGLAYARRRGDRTQELAFVAQLAGSLFEEGRWDELEDLAAELPEEMLRLKNAVASQIPGTLALINYHRGDRQRTAELIHEWAALKPSPDVNLDSFRSWSRAMAALLEERCDAALALIRSRLRAPANTGDLEAHVDLAAEAIAGAEATSALGELVALADAAGVPKPPSTAAAIARLRAKIEALSGADEPGFERAVAQLRESDSRVTLAMALVEQAEWLAAAGRSDEAEPLVAEAREIFSRLRATPWLDRIDAISPMRERVPS